MNMLMKMTSQNVSCIVLVGVLRIALTDILLASLAGSLFELCMLCALRCVDLSEAQLRQLIQPAKGYV